MLLPIGIWLNFAYIYCTALNEITTNQDMNLQEFELSNDNWKIVKDLSAVLKVCI